MPAEGCIRCSGSTEIFDYLPDRTVSGAAYVDGRIKAAFDEYVEECRTRVLVYG